MASFHGYLFCKLDWIGTKSEGPAYYLQCLEPPGPRSPEPPDSWDIRILKKTQRWEKDPELHQHLATKVQVEGELRPEGIDYNSVGPADSI